MSKDEEFYSFSNDPSDAFTLEPPVATITAETTRSAIETSPGSTLPDDSVSQNTLNKKTSISTSEFKDLKPIPSFNPAKKDFRKSAPNLRQFQIDDSQLDKLKRMSSNLTKQQALRDLLQSPIGNTANRPRPHPNHVMAPQAPRQPVPQNQSGIYLDDDPGDECKPIASLTKTNSVPVAYKPMLLPSLPPPIPPVPKLSPQVLQKIHTIHLNKSRMYEFRRGRPLKTKPSRQRRYDIPKPNLKFTPPEIPVKEASDEKRTVPKRKKTKKFHSDTSKSVPNLSTILKPELTDTHEVLNDKVKDILDQVHAEMNKITDIAFVDMKIDAPPPITEAKLE